jgi:hypothetical protein
MAQPNTTSMATFVEDVVKHGGEEGTALTIAGMVVMGQHPGLYPNVSVAVASGVSPDIYKLDNAPPISHNDRYLAHFNEVREEVAKRTCNGLRPNVSYQDTVDLKKMVAVLSGTRQISQASQLETQILFIRAGGDLDTGSILARDWLGLLQGLAPTGTGLEVGPGEYGFVGPLSIWKVQQLEPRNTWADLAMEPRNITCAPEAVSAAWVLGPETLLILPFALMVAQSA